MDYLDFIFVLFVYSFVFSQIVGQNPLPCLLSENGASYKGYKNTSQSHKICKSWSAGVHKYTVEKLRLKHLDENFCRNPNNSSTVWCFVDHNDTEPCNVPSCQVNPKSKFCIPIPKADFKGCPSLFTSAQLFKGNVQFGFVLCCIQDRFDPTILPIKNNCLLISIESELLAPHHSPCPIGYFNQKVTDNLIESRVIYQCCRHDDANSSLIVDQIVKNQFKISKPMFGSITNLSCNPVTDFYSEMIEYTDLDNFVDIGFHPNLKLCLYYLIESQSNVISESQLGLISLKYCPPDFHEFDIILLNTTGGPLNARSCWPISKTYIYPIGPYCLLTKGNIASYCPKKYQSYIIRHSRTSRDIRRFCCQSQSSSTSSIMWSNSKMDNVSIAFVKITDECPFMMSNTSMSSVLINVSIILNLPTDTDSNGSSSRDGISNPITSICSYEPSIDHFAYKKVGQSCPPGMSISSIEFYSLLYLESDLPLETFTMDYCVGNLNLRLESFPKGRYCIYKIDGTCPLGFFPQAKSDMRQITTTKGSVPNYTDSAYCCRKDDNNDKMMHPEQFPFINGKIKVPFGLILLRAVDQCPRIFGFQDYHDVFKDGYLCSYLSDKDSYILLNTIIFPSLLTERNTTYFIRKNWTSLNELTYVSSVVMKHPQSQYCIVSDQRCISRQGIDFTVAYPIVDQYLCCYWPRNESTDTNAPLEDRTKYKSIGFVSIRGACPQIDDDFYFYQGIIEEIFEIKRFNVKDTYIADLLKIGIVSDLHTKKDFVKIKFTFCLFQPVDELLLTDKYKSQNLNGFLIPFRNKCPDHCIERTHTLLIDSGRQRNAISAHFIKINNNASYARFCFPKNMSDDYIDVMRSSTLCSFTYNGCPNETKTERINLFSIQTNSNYSVQMFICCNNRSEAPNSNLNSFSHTFSLPLKPGSKLCPVIKTWNFERWKISLKQQSTHRILILCLYYQVPLAALWPLGSYMTIPFKEHCPPFFILLYYKTSSICIRNTTDFGSSKFPQGQYCVLSYRTIQCPLTGHWTLQNQTFDYNHHSYLTCCSTSSDMIFNIPISEKHTFTFLSNEKCSIIPGTRVVMEPFLNLVRCVYVPLLANETSNRYVENAPRKRVENNSGSLQIVISVLLITMLAILIGMVVTYVLYPKIRQVQLGLSSANQFRLQSMYKDVDTTSIKVYSELDEKTPSIIYSTI